MLYGIEILYVEIEILEKRKNENLKIFRNQKRIYIYKY